MTVMDYIHGYSGRENERLYDQANTLADLLHHDTRYPAGSRVLEAGCGVGAQTITLTQGSPDAHFTSMDVSPASIAAARALLRRRGVPNVTFLLADVYDLPFSANSYDHVFVCFLLEHMRQPLAALERLKSVLRHGGTLTVIEGDHASACFYPQSAFAQRTIDCLVAMQARAGGNALIGRQLYPLLKQAGYKDINVTPRHVYADASRPQWVEGFTKNTFTAMVDGVKQQALRMGLMDAEMWERGIADLYATAGEDGTFNYTFFKGVAVK
jgi:ubiquinone/menaquinone biosynthesis C-methylase UbiE